MQHLILYAGVPHTVRHAYLLLVVTGEMSATVSKSLVPEF